MTLAIWKNFSKLLLMKIRFEFSNKIFVGLFSGECARFYASYDFSHFSLDQCHRWTRAPLPCRRYELPRKAKLSMAYKYESEDNQGIVLTYFLTYVASLLEYSSHF